MHFIGMAGMPRRIPDYADGYLNWNLIMTLGTFLTIISVLILLYNVIQLLLIRGAGVKSVKGVLPVWGCSWFLPPGIPPSFLHSRY